MSIDSESYWHFDKRVPIVPLLVLVLTVGGQTFGFAWYLSGQNERLHAVERDAAELISDNRSEIARRAQREQRIAAVEAVSAENRAEAERRRDAATLSNLAVATRLATLETVLDGLQTTQRRVEGKIDAVLDAARR